MNKAIDVLYNEHKVIKSVIEYRERISEISKINPVKFKTIMKELVAFFRGYADKFHHYKEEKILFPLMAEKNEMLEGSIIAEMLDNHNDFRELIRQIESSTDSGSPTNGYLLLFKYTEQLLDHIAVEDEELFQMAETLFDDKDLEKMYFDFEDIDRELGLDSKKQFENIKVPLDSLIN